MKHVQIIESRLLQFLYTLHSITKVENVRISFSSFTVIIYELLYLKYSQIKPESFLTFKNKKYEKILKRVNLNIQDVQGADSSSLIS